MEYGMLVDHLPSIKTMRYGTSAHSEESEDEGKGLL